MQRFVYTMAKNEHTEDPNEGSAHPSGMNDAQQFNQATSRLQ